MYVCGIGKVPIVFFVLAYLAADTSVAIRLVDEISAPNGDEIPAPISDEIVGAEDHLLEKPKDGKKGKKGKAKDGKKGKKGKAKDGKKGKKGKAKDGKKGKKGKDGKKGKKGKAVGKKGKAKDEKKGKVEDLILPDTYTSSIHGRGPKALMGYLLKRFQNETLFPVEREELAAIRELDMAGDSSGDSDSDRKFRYLETGCMQKRVHWAAKIMKEYKCKRILEVGGFRTPLPAVVGRSSLPQELEMYVDVDPSANGTQEEHFGNYSAATFQLLLDEFRAPGLKGVPTNLTSIQRPHLGSNFDCFLGLGTSQQNIGDDDGKQSMENALVGSGLVVVEFPVSNTYQMDKHLYPLMGRAGFTEVAEQIFNCSMDKASLDARDTQNACGSRNDGGYETKKEAYNGTLCLQRRGLVFKRNFLADPVEIKDLMKGKKVEDAGKAAAKSVVLAAAKKVQG